MIYTLVETLGNQIETIDEDIEIIAIDDASKTEYTIENRAKCKAVTNYIELEQNIGRARIRNLFLNYTSQSYLLFLDCDVAIHSDDFIQRYINLIKTSTVDVVTGGHQYTEKQPGASCALRWKYGRKRESQEAAERRKKPYKSFKTSNFLIQRNLFSEVPFNENLHGYGHEDTLFGFELKCRQVKMLHINNPVYIEKTDTNAVFLNKTRESIRSMLKIVKMVEYDKRLINDIKLLSTYFWLKKRRLVNLVFFVYVMLKPLIYKLLISGKVVSLTLFNFYKLGFLIRLVKKNEGEYLL